MYTTNLKKDEDSFNGYMNSAGVVVETTFGKLKGRWRRLFRAIDVQVQFSPTILSACCVLHNIVETRESSFRKSWLDLNSEERNLTKKYPQPETEIFQDSADVAENF